MASPILRGVLLTRRTWISCSIPIVTVILWYSFITKDYFAMRSSSSLFFAAVTATLAGHGKAADIDLGWYKPNATAINNLDEIIQGDGVWGYIYNSSVTPDSKYGIYNWCNMPHVRKTEYKKAPAGFKLQYVELVSILLLDYYSKKLTNFIDSTPPQTNSICFQCLPRRSLRLGLCRPRIVLLW